MTNKELIVPAISPALIRYLDEVYPERTPGRDESLEDIRFKSGQRDVVRKLIVHFKRQTNPQT